jgi:biotin carboxylase
MTDITRRVMLHLGLVNTLFNIEMIYDASSDAIHIIEINPRLCGQFADLYEKVDGTNGYEVALALATGERPRLKKRAGHSNLAASVPLRVFEPVSVNRAPSGEDLRAAEALYPGTLVWSECETGQEMGDFAWCEDGQSARYGIINLGADDGASLAARLDQVKARLGFSFSPLAR